MILRVAFCIFVLSQALFTQSPSPTADASKTGSISTQGPTTSTSPAASPARRYHPERFAGRAGTYYRVVWGVDELSVKSAESGEVIRFTYQVLDPTKAKLLNDTKLEPVLIDERAHVKLSVPQMDKVGKLRQTADPVSGRSYWMLFSNKGGFVKRGDKVKVVIGSFHADGLVVD